MQKLDRALSCVCYHQGTYLPDKKCPAKILVKLGDNGSDLTHKRWLTLNINYLVSALILPTISARLLALVGRTHLPIGGSITNRNGAVIGWLCAKLGEVLEDAQGAVARGLDRGFDCVGYYFDKGGA